MQRPQPLPVDKLLPRAIQALQEAPALVLRSPTGSGKTTRLPPALEAAGLGPVLLLEPRRLSARAAAARMAHEAGEPLGKRFGYRVRFDSRTSASTRVTAVTEGIFLRQLLSDPFLEGVGCVVFDEFHERHMDGDLALALVRKIQKEVRPELRIVILSATLDTAELAQYLEAEVITSEGKLYPVAVQHQPAQGREPLEQQVLRATEDLCAKTAGDLLVFLPGKAEIGRAQKALAPLAARLQFGVHALHGDLSPGEQDAALRKGTRRRVVLSTNLAESSVTVDGVTGVIDSGLARIPIFDAQRGIDKLELTRISMQSVQQRAGRAGRQEAGFNLRLWSRFEEGGLSPAGTPEVMRVDLAGAWLALLDFGESEPQDFDWFEAPLLPSQQSASELLLALGATRSASSTNTPRITSLGRELARLPLPPRLGRLLLAGKQFGCLKRAALAAAMISERDALRDVTERMDSARVVESDILERIELLEDHDRGRGSRDVHRMGARQIFAVRDQLLRSVNHRGEHGESGQDDALLRAVFTAYADRLARRRSSTARSKQTKRTKKVAQVARFQTAQEHRALLRDGRGARLGRACHVTEEKLFVCIELSAGSGEAEIRQASGVQQEWLDEEGFEERIECVFDADKDQARWLRTKTWRGLVLHEAQLSQAKGHGQKALEGALLGAAEVRLARAFNLEDEAYLQLLARWNCLDQWAPELGFGSLDPEGWIREHLHELVRGKKSFAELREIPLAARLKGSLDHPKGRLLEEMAPTRFPLPAGRSAAIFYSPGKPPVLAARLQHFFGLDSTPSIARGRVPLLLHLCAPNGRPEQITSDLQGFWRGSYALVRKELKGRYPRQDWPLDPLNFTPKARPPRGGRGKR